MCPRTSYTHLKLQIKFIELKAVSTSGATSVAISGKLREQRCCALLWAIQLADTPWIG